ncbi:MAG: MscS family rane protein [Candidatus Woesearchaeota archaeon]|nr:MscS family rane protein [Candidatus Woesearchaeota archaeon]
MNELLQNSIAFDIVIGIIIFIGVLIIGLIVQRFLKKRLLKLASKTKIKTDDVLIEKALPWISWLFILIAARIAIGYTLDFSVIPEYVDKIFYSVLTVFILFFSVHISRMLIELFNRLYSKKKDISVKNPLLPLFTNLAKAAIAIIGFLIILSIWGVKIGPFLGALGIVGLAISLAVQDSLKDLFGGISLILDKTLKVGDMIQLDDGTSGIVYDMSLRSSKIRTWDNESIIFPNSILANSKIHNVEGPNPPVRAVIPFSVAYGSDVDKVEKVVLDSIKKVKNCLDDPAPSVTFDSFGDFSLNFNAKFWVPNRGLRYEAGLEARKLIYEALNKNNITIPFPTHVLYIKEEGSKSTKKKKTN